MRSEAVAKIADRTVSQQAI